MANRLVALGALVALVAWLYASGVSERVDLAAVREFLRQGGLSGGALFVVSYAVLQPLGVNGLVFLLSAPMVWGLSQAFLLNWLGTVGCGLTSFALARFVARDWVQARMPTRLAAFDDRLHTRGFTTVLWLRLLFYTNPPFQYGLGVSRVRMGPFLAGTVVGVVPMTLLLTLLGTRIEAWLSKYPPSSWPWDRIGLAGVVVLVVVIAVVGLRRRRA